jgi:hypothetical protein
MPSEVQDTHTTDATITSPGLVPAGDRWGEAPQASRCSAARSPRGTGPLSMPEPRVGPRLTPSSRCPPEPRPHRQGNRKPTSAAPLPRCRCRIELGPMQTRQPKSGSEVRCHRGYSDWRTNQDQDTEHQDSDGAAFPTGGFPLGLFESMKPDPDASPRLSTGIEPSWPCERRRPMAREVQGIRATITGASLRMPQWATAEGQRSKPSSATRSPQGALAPQHAQGKSPP